MSRTIRRKHDTWILRENLRFRRRMLHVYPEQFSSSVEENLRSVVSKFFQDGKTSAVYINRPPNWYYHQYTDVPNRVQRRRLERAALFREVDVTEFNLWNRPKPWW